MINAAGNGHAGGGALGLGAPTESQRVIVLCRVDNRLIHGQVIEAWLPHLKVRRLVVADDETAADSLARSVMTLAVPPQVAVVLEPVARVDYRAMALDDVKTLVLFRDIEALARAVAAGLPPGTVNLGNVHAGPGRLAISRSVFLSEGDRSLLRELASAGMTVVVQAVPTDAPLPLAA